MAQEQVMDAPEGTESAQETPASPETPEPNNPSTADPNKSAFDSQYLKPGILWPELQWPEEGRLNVFEWSVVSVGLVCLLLIFGGALSYKFPPFQPLALCVGLLGMGAINLAVALQSMKAWNSQPQEMWRAGLLGLLLLFYFGMATAFGLQAAHVVSPKEGNTLIFFGVVFLGFYLALRYLYELTFHWKQSSGGLFLWIGLVLQASSLILFRHFYLVPAFALSFVALCFTLSALLRKVLDYSPALSKLLVAANLALCLPESVFLYQDYHAPRQAVQHFTRLVGGLSPTVANLQWSPAVEKKDIEGMKRSFENRFSSKISFTTLEGKERVFSIYDAASGVGVRQKLSVDFEGSAWSPDASALIFCAKNKNEGDQRLWFFNLSDSTLRDLKSNQKDEPQKDMVLPAPRPIGPHNIWPNPYEQAWSKDSRHIVIAAREHGYMRIAEIDSEGNQVRTLAKGAYLYPAWSPLGGKVMFVRKTGDGRWVLVVERADGSSAKEIFTTPQGEILPPVWSPDGKRIAFVLKAGSNYSIFTIGSDGKTPRHFFNTQDALSLVQWSPHSDRLAFLVRRKVDSKDEVWTARGDAMDPVKLYESRGTLNHLSWSPDNQFLAVEEKTQRWVIDGDVCTVLLIDIHNQEARLILPYHLFSKAPVFSPNGTLLAFVGSSTRWLPGNKQAVWIARINQE